MIRKQEYKTQNEKFDASDLPITSVKFVVRAQKVIKITNSVLSLKSTKETVTTTNYVIILKYKYLICDCDTSSPYSSLSEGRKLMSSTAGNPFGTLYGGPLHQQPTSSGNQAANSAIPPPLGKLRLKLIKLEYIPRLKKFPKY